MKKKHTEEDYYFDKIAGERPVKFIEKYCRHIVGDQQGQLIQMMDYQKQIVRDVFGWKKKADNYRRYRNVYLEVPKKNAKSTLLAALGLYHTCADGEKGAEVFACAGDKDQARIIFDTSREMIEADKTLSKIFKVYKNVIVHKKSKSRFRVISADAKTKHGFNVHVLLFDELHVQPNSELWHTMAKGVAARKQPIVWAITTAGYKNTFAHNMHNMAMQIQAGRIQSKFWYVKIYAATEKEGQKDYDKEWLWKRTNPGYGITVGREFFEAQMEEIQQNPANLSAFLRLHLNVWTGSEKTWEIVPHWYKGDKPTNIKPGQVGYMGVDLAPVNDTTAVVEWYPNEEHESFDVYAHFFIPESTLEDRIKQENDNWQMWVHMGLVTVMPGNISNQKTIYEYIMNRCQTQQIERIGCDTYNAYDLIAKLQEAGLPAEAYPQTLKGMSPPMRFLEKQITAGNVNHEGNPVLSYQAGNVVVYEDINQNRRPHKKNSKSRIDGIAALITSIGCYLADITETEEKYTASELLGFIETDAAE